MQYSFEIHYGKHFDVFVQANIGATGWGKRAEINGLEVSDFQNRALFVLFRVWMNSIVINCRSSNAPLVPDPGSRSNENLLNDGRKWSGFFTYDHLMDHILTNWRVSNCGGVARGLAPWVEGGATDTGNAGMVCILAISSQKPLLLVAHIYAVPIFISLEGHDSCQWPCSRSAIDIKRNAIRLANRWWSGFCQ